MNASLQRLLANARASTAERARQIEATAGKGFPLLTGWLSMHADSVDDGVAAVRAARDAGMADFDPDADTPDLPTAKNEESPEAIAARILGAR